MYFVCMYMYLWLHLFIYVGKEKEWRVYLQLRPPVSSQHESPLPNAAVDISFF